MKDKEVTIQKWNNEPSSTRYIQQIKKWNRFEKSKIHINTLQLNLFLIRGIVYFYLFYLFFQTIYFCFCYFIFNFNFISKIILKWKPTIDIQIQIQQSKTTIRMRVRKQTMNNEIQISQRDTFQDIKKDLCSWPITPIQMNKRGTSLTFRKSKTRFIDLLLFVWIFQFFKIILISNK